MVNKFIFIIQLSLRVFIIDLKYTYALYVTKYAFYHN